MGQGPEPEDALDRALHAPACQESDDHAAAVLERIRHRVVLEGVATARANRRLRILVSALLASALGLGGALAYTAYQRWFLTLVDEDGTPVRFEVLERRGDDLEVRDEDGRRVVLRPVPAEAEHDDAEPDR